MNWTEIRAWVKELGTPIAAAIFLGWLVVRLSEEGRADRAAELAAHQVEIKQIVDAFRACCRNTQVAP